MSAGRPEGGLAAPVTEMNARKGQDMRAEHTGRLLRGMVSLASGMLLATGALAADGGLGLKVDSLRVELGGFTDHPRASGDAFASVAVSAGGGEGDWSYALGARLDAFSQFGSADFTRVRADYTENYLRWRGEDLRLTLGTQNVMWGRVDEISPIDRMSRVDLSRAMLDKLPDRRRAVPAVRAEYFGADFKLDAVWLPVFDEAVMPHGDSVWHPVDTVKGRLLGFGTLPGLAGVKVREADEDGSGGGGLRLTAGGDGLDYGVSVQRVRQSQPYYRVSPGVLTAIHPYDTVIGAELEAERLGATWRMELAWRSDVPLTTPGFQYRTDPGVDLVVGAEFFPGDGETRVTLQLAGHRTLTDVSVLDRTEFYVMTGEIEHPFAHGRWRADLRFMAGLGERDVYLNPRLTYTGIDQHELFVAAHVFSGSEQTLGGYYSRNDSVMVGWQAKF